MTFQSLDCNKLSNIIQKRFLHQHITVLWYCLYLGIDDYLDAQLFGLVDWTSVLRPFQETNRLITGGYRKSDLVK